MRSSALPSLAVAVLVLGRGAPAAAQGAPPDDLEPAGPADDDEPDDAATPADDDAAATDTPDTPDAADAPDAAPDAPDAAPDRRADRPSIVVGLELGVGGVIGGGSEVHGAGFGRGFSIGVRWRQTSLEWHFAELYDAPVDAGLVASNAAGQLSMSSLGLRLAPTPTLSVYGGIAYADVPLLVRDSDTVVRGSSIEGIGPIAGVAVGWSAGPMAFGLELRLARLLITDAVPPHLTVTGPADASGTIPVTTDHASLHPTIATLTVTVRLAD